MGFDRGEIRIKATIISIMDRKGGKSIMGCRVMSGAITNTASAHSHLLLFVVVGVVEVVVVAAAAAEVSLSIPSILLFCLSQRRYT